MLLNRRNLLGTGSAMLALAAFGNKFALAAGTPGLTTHMLDTANGKPAEGVKIDFSVLEGGAYKLIRTVHTNADGRNAEPLLTPETMKAANMNWCSMSANTSPSSGPCCPIRLSSRRP
jgi:hypothetical protein